MYRRPASKYRRTPYGQKREEEPETLPIVYDSEDISMPNEADITPLPLSDNNSENIPSFRFIGKDFFLDDIILIGLLIILLQEKVQDELLLIVIIYILFF